MRSGLSCFGLTSCARFNIRFCVKRRYVAFSLSDIFAHTATCTCGSRFSNMEPTL